MVDYRSPEVIPQLTVDQALRLQTEGLKPVVERDIADWFEWYCDLRTTEGERNLPEVVAKNVAMIAKHIEYIHEHRERNARGKMTRAELLSAMPLNQLLNFKPKGRI